MKKLLLLSLSFALAFSIELDFKKTALDKFELQGFSTHVVYKNKEHRDLQIARLWEKFLTSRDFDVNKSTDKKLYVVYTNYQKNAFDCFIGIQSKQEIFDSELKIVPKSNYQKAILAYEKNMKISDIWDEMQEKKIERDFKTDIEQYEMSSLLKEKQFINIYLSTK